MEIMRKNIFALPIRSAPSLRHNSLQWARRRCFATQLDGSKESRSDASSTTATFPITVSEEFASDSNLVTHQSSDDSKPHSDIATLPLEANRLANEQNEIAGFESSLPKYPFRSVHELARQAIPPQYLAHVDPELLTPREKLQAEGLTKHKRIVGVVVSAGKMDKTVKVRVADQQWNKQLKKNFRHEVNHMVRDPNNSLVVGDVIELHRLRCSKLVQHVVGQIINPFGKGIHERPPVPTPVERLNAYKDARRAKRKAREERLQLQNTDGSEDSS